MTTINKNLVMIMWLALLVLAAIVAPMPTLIVAALLLLAVYTTKSQKLSSERMLGLFSQLNATRLWLAVGLTLTSLMISDRTQFITRFGFPTPVATSYNYPQTFSEEHWFTFVTRLAINPLQGLVNLVFFYLAVSVVNWLWRKVISRRSG